MTAYIIEKLLACGWRRDDELRWTLADAKRESNRLIESARATRVRVLPVRIEPSAIAEYFLEDEIA